MALYIDRFGEAKIIHPFQGLWHLYKLNNAAMFGLLILSIVVIVLILTPVFAPYEADRQFINALFSPPSWAKNGHIEYLFGTDELGRDIFSRVLIGGRTTISSAMLVILMASSVGVTLSLLGTSIGGWLDKSISWFFELLLTFPSLITSLLVVALLGPGLFNAVIAVAIAMIPLFYTTTRSETLNQMRQPYFAAAQLDGAKGLRLLTSTLIPNISNPIFIQFSLSLSSAILEIATLGFLGFGAQSPQTEWGTILGESRAYSYQAPWVIWLPGLSMFLTLFAIKLVTDGVRETLEYDQQLK